MTLALVGDIKVSEYITWAGGIARGKKMSIAFFSRVTMSPLTGSKCGHGQGSERACVMLDYSLQSEQ